MKAAEITDALIAALRTRRATASCASTTPTATWSGTPGICDADDRSRCEAVDLQLGRLLPVIERARAARCSSPPTTATPTRCSRSTRGRRAGARRRGPPEGEDQPHPEPGARAHIYAPGAQLALREACEQPGLANVAATVLQLLGYAAPDDYEPSLLADR